VKRPSLEVHGGDAGSGLIVCYDRRGDCYVDLPALNIWRAPLRALRAMYRLPRQVEQAFFARVVWWLRRAARAQDHSAALFDGRQRAEDRAHSPRFPPSAFLQAPW